MNTWKIKNISNVSVRFACRIGMASKGIILEPNKLCIVDPQLTATIDSQVRRKFIEIDREFDNTKYRLELGIPFSEEKIKVIDQKFTDQEKEAEKKIEEAVKILNPKPVKKDKPAKKEISTSNKKSKLEVAEEGAKKYINKKK